MGFRIFKNRDDARKTRILLQCLQEVWVWSPVRHDQAANDFRLGFVSLPKLQGIELPSRTPKRFGLIRNLGNLGNRSGIYRIRLRLPSSILFTGGLALGLLIRSLNGSSVVLQKLLPRLQTMGYAC